MFLIELEQSSNNKQIYNTSIVCNTIVKVEPPRANRNIPPNVQDVNVTDTQKTIVIHHQHALSVQARISQSAARWVKK